MNRDMTPGPPEGQEPIEQLFRDVFGLAEDTARRITDAEVDARLDQLLRKTGHAAAPAPEPDPDPASVLDAARRQAAAIIADAQRATAEKTAEAACTARSAEDAARRQAESIIAEAEKYSDMALSQAAAIIAAARGQAESIIAEAKEQASRIIADARHQAAQTDSRARQPAPAGNCALWTQGLLAAIYDATAESEPAQSHGRLPGPPFPDSRDTSQDQASPGWLHRSWKSIRSHWQSWLGSVAADCLAIRPADSIEFDCAITIIIVTACIAHIPEDDTHTAGLPALPSSFCYRKAIQAGNPQDGGLASIRGNGAARSIEASY